MLKKAIKNMIYGISLSKHEKYLLKLTGLSMLIFIFGVFIIILC